MRKFRFVGDPSEMHWYINPEKGESYDILQLNAMRNGDLLEFWMIENDRSWQEVTDGKTHIIDTTKPLHKDTDLGMFSAMFVQGLLSNSGHCQTFSGNNPNPVPSYVVEISIELAKELIKQLNEETK